MRNKKFKKKEANEEGLSPLELSDQWGDLQSDGGSHSDRGRSHSDRGKGPSSQEVPGLVESEE